jgi:hypothetical protein
MKLLLENWRHFLNESVNPEEELYLGEIQVEDKIIPVFLNPKDGIGQIPWNQNVNYMGFVVYMTPAEFLALNPRREFSTDKLTEFMLSQDELRIGPPWLQIRWDKEAVRWVVKGHEGRGRMEVLNEYIPNEKIPVHVFPRGMRARDVTDEMLFADILADPRGATEGTFSPAKVILNGETRTQ